MTAVRSIARSLADKMISQIKAVKPGVDVSAFTHEAQIQQTRCALYRGVSKHTNGTTEVVREVDLLAQKGTDALADLPAGGDEKAVTATIELNIRKVISDEQPTNPEYYAKMSKSLDSLIARCRKEASEYKSYLQELIALARDVRAGDSENYPPTLADSKAKQALYDNLQHDEKLAIAVHQAVQGSRRAKWLGNAMRESRIRYAIGEALKGQEDLVEQTFEIVKRQPENRG